jgi:predicted enzyme related to lactoylglutathione lyase
VAGTIGWADLTVPDADGIRDFYAAVTGWVPQALSMGDYADYVMTAPTSSTPIAGVCHARGTNAGLPPVWLVYISVTDLDASLAACIERGGVVVTGPKNGGGGSRYAVIRDPAGAMAALHQATT